MTTRLTSVKAIYFLFALTIGFAACKKEVSSSASSTVSSSPVIAVSASESASSTGASTDSVYIIQPCERGSHRDTISQSALLVGITDYLTANYSGYTFSKAFVVKDTSGTITNYVVIIYYNDKPVALLFDSSGNFLKILEQREKGDLDGEGWHEGGRFCDRDGLQKDTIALSSLPSSILSYFATNYPQDTLLKAFRERDDSNYIVISKDNGLFATIFDSNGNFVKRVSLPMPAGVCVSVAQSALPTNVLSYLSTTYPNYVFEKAFAVYNNSVLQGYVVIINANNTKYAVRFDASGNFVSVKTIW